MRRVRRGTYPPLRRRRKQVWAAAVCTSACASRASVMQSAASCWRKRRKVSSANQEAWAEFKGEAMRVGRVQRGSIGERPSGEADRPRKLGGKLEEKQNRACRA